MKYIYKNVTSHIQTVLLASKDQTKVENKVFYPGFMVELDYPGLNLYVPNILSCITIDAPALVTAAEVKEVKQEVVKELEEVKQEVKEPEVVKEPEEVEQEAKEPETVKPKFKPKAKPIKKSEKK